MKVEITFDFQSIEAIEVEMEVIPRLEETILFPYGMIKFSSGRDPDITHWRVTNIFHYPFAKDETKISIGVEGIV